MRARLLPPYDHYSGNLLWHKPEASQRGAQLAEGLERLRLLGYWASPFPEDDGLTFRWLHGEKSRKELLNDFQKCFGAWTIELSSSKDGNAELAELSADDTVLCCTVIVPIEKVHLESTKEISRNFHLRCSSEFDVYLDTRLSDHEGPYLQFDADLRQKDLLLLRRRIEHDNIVISHCLGLAEGAMDLVRFQFSSFVRPEFTPNPAGQLADGTYAVEIVPPSQTHLKPMILRGIVRPMGASNNWLGPEVDTVLSPGCGRLAEIVEGREDPVSSNVKTALRYCRQAFYTLGEESRFLSLIFALDCLLSPPHGLQAWRHRVYVAAIISNGRESAFEDILEQYDELYTDVRNALVHRGKDFYELGRSSSQCCERIHDYVRAVVAVIEAEDLSSLDDLYALANMWAGSPGYAQRASAVIARVSARRGKAIPTFNWTSL